MASSGKRSPFLESVRDGVRVRHLSDKTEQAYTHWVRRFVLHHGKRHPRDLGEAEVAEFLTHLAMRRRVAGRRELSRCGARATMWIPSRGKDSDRGSKRNIARR